MAQAEATAALSDFASCWKGVARDQACSGHMPFWCLCGEFGDVAAHLGTQGGMDGDCLWGVRDRRIGLSTLRRSLNDIPADMLGVAIGRSTCPRHVGAFPFRSPLTAPRSVPARDLDS